MAMGIDKAIWPTGRCNIEAWAIARRAARAAFTVANALSPLQLKKMLSEPHDLDILLAVIRDEAVLQSLKRQQDDPLTAPRARGVERRKAMILESGGVLSIPEAAMLLGITRQAVDKRVRSRGLLAIIIGRQAAIPAFQISQGAVLRGLSKVLRALQVDDPWTRLNFFLMRHPALANQRPADVLGQGHIEPVVQVAAGFGSQGSA